MGVLLSPGDFDLSLLERFLRYVALCTMSDTAKADKGKTPSTEGQLELATMLASELSGLGLEEARVTPEGYVRARLSPTKGRESAPAVCFLAHLDTSESASGAGVSPVVKKNYDGSVITLKEGVCLDPAQDLALAQARGQTVIHADGTTLLGADDKAGIAEILTALEALKKGDKPHGLVEVIFSPDEETGHGMDKVPLSWMKAKAAYTLDGGGAPEVEAECFNAYKSEVVFRGIARHTGTARPDMVNAVNLAADFIALLPRHESPETTDCRQGFFTSTRVTGVMEKSSVVVLLRDFDSRAMRERLKTVETLAAAVSRKYTGSAFTVTHTKQYDNMKAGIEKNPLVLDLLVKAIQITGNEPVFKPIRGGTDGSRLTEMGIPTPNIFTGGHNYHSKTEWASLEEMSLAVRVIIDLALLWGQQ
jgi:tripeptide aminopeptidase